MPSLSSSKQIFNAVHIKAEREAQCLVQRVALGRGNDVASIEREHAHLKACTHGKVFAVTFVFRLVMVSGTQRKLIVVDIFSTHAPLYLLQLFFKAAGGIAKALKDAAD